MKLVLSKLLALSSLVTLGNAVANAQVAQIGATPEIETRAQMPRSQLAVLPQERRIAGVIRGMPSCVRRPDFVIIDCYARGAGSELLEATFANGAWSPWHSLPGATLSSDPACANPGPGRLTRETGCIATSRSGGAIVAKRNPTPFAGGPSHRWFALPRDEVSAVSRANCKPSPMVAGGYDLEDGREPVVFCFVRNGASGALYWLQFNPDEFPGQGDSLFWRAALPPTAASDPVCFLVRHAGHVDARCFALGPARQLLEWQLYVQRGSGSESRVQEIRDWGGVLTSPPACVQDTTAGIRCFARGQNGQIWYRTVEREGAGGWESLPGLVASTPSCVATRQGVSCFATNGGNRLWRVDVTTRRAAEIRGTARLLSEPACLAVAAGPSGNPNRIHCVVRDVDSRAVHFEMEM